MHREHLILQAWLKATAIQVLSLACSSAGALFHVDQFLGTGQCRRPVGITSQHLAVQSSPGPGPSPGISLYLSEFLGAEV